MAEIIFSCSATQIFGLDKFVANYKRIAATEILAVEKLWLAAAEAQASAAGGLGTNDINAFSDSNALTPGASASRHGSLIMSNFSFGNVNTNSSFNHPNPSFVAHIADNATPPQGAVRRGSPGGTNTPMSGGGSTPQLPRAPPKILGKPTVEHLMRIKKRAAELPALIEAKIAYNRRILNRFEERSDFDAVIGEVLEWAFDPRAPLLIHALGEHAVPTTEEWKELTRDSDDEETQDDNTKSKPRGLRKIKKKKDINQLRIDYYNKKLVAGGVVSSVINARDAAILLRLLDAVQSDSWEPVAESFSSSEEEDEDVGSNAHDKDAPPHLAANSKNKKKGDMGEESVLIPGFSLSTKGAPPNSPKKTAKKKKSSSISPLLLVEDVVSKILQSQAPSRTRLKAAASYLLHIQIASSPSALFDNLESSSNAISPFGSIHSPPSPGAHLLSAESSLRGGQPPLIISPVAAQAEAAVSGRVLSPCDNQFRHDGTTSDGCIVMSREEIEAARGCVAFRTINVSSKGLLYICDEVGDLVLHAISLSEDVAYVKVLLGLLTDAVDLTEADHIRARQLKRGITTTTSAGSGGVIASVKRVGRQRLVAESLEGSSAFTFGNGGDNSGNHSKSINKAQEEQARQVNHMLRLKGSPSLGGSGFSRSGLSFDVREQPNQPLMLLEENEKRVAKMESFKKGGGGGAYPPLPLPPSSSSRATDEANTFAALALNPLDNFTAPDRTIEFRSALVTESRGISLSLRAPPSTTRSVPPEPIRLFFPSHAKVKEFVRIIKRFVHEDSPITAEKRRVASNSSTPRNAQQRVRSQMGDAPTAPPSKRPSSVGLVPDLPNDNVDDWDYQQPQDRHVDGLLSNLLEVSVRDVRVKSGRDAVSSDDKDDDDDSADEFLDADADVDAVDIDSRRRRAVREKLKKERIASKASVSRDRREKKISDLKKLRSTAAEEGDEVTLGEANREIARLEAEGRGEQFDDDDEGGQRRKIPLTEGERRKANLRLAARERDVEAAKKAIGWVEGLDESSSKNGTAAQDKCNPVNGAVDDGDDLDVAEEIAEKEFGLMLKAAQREDEKKRRTMDSIGTMLYPAFSLDDHYNRIEKRAMERDRELAVAANEKAMYVEGLTTQLRAQQDTKASKEQQRRLESLRQQRSDLQQQSRGGDDDSHMMSTPRPASTRSDRNRPTPLRRSDASGRGSLSPSRTGSPTSTTGGSTQSRRGQSSPTSRDGRRDPASRTPTSASRAAGGGSPRSDGRARRPVPGSPTASTTGGRRGPTSPTSPTSPPRRQDRPLQSDNGKIYSTMDAANGVTGIPVATVTPENVNATNHERKQAHYDVYYERVKAAEEKRTKLEKKLNDAKRLAAQDAALAEMFEEPDVPVSSFPSKATSAATSAPARQSGEPPASSSSKKQPEPAAPAKKGLAPTAITTSGNKNPPPPPASSSGKSGVPKPKIAPVASGSSSPTQHHHPPPTAAASKAPPQGASTSTPQPSRTAPPGGVIGSAWTDGSGSASPRDKKRIEALCREVEEKEAAYKQALRATGVAPSSSPFHRHQPSSATDRQISRIFDEIMDPTPRPLQPVFRTTKQRDDELDARERSAERRDNHNDQLSHHDRIPTESPLTGRVSSPSPDGKRARDQSTANTTTPKKPATSAFSEDDNKIMLESLPFPNFGPKYSYYDHKEFAYTVLRNETEEAHYVLETKPRFDRFMDDLAKRSDAERRRILQAAGKARMAASVFSQSTGSSSASQSQHQFHHPRSDTASTTHYSAPSSTSQHQPPHDDALSTKYAAIAKEMLPFSYGIQKRTDELAAKAATTSRGNTGISNTSSSHPTTSTTRVDYNYLPESARERLDTTRNQLKSINENVVVGYNMKRKLLHGELPHGEGICGFCLRIRGGGTSKDAPGVDPNRPAISSTCTCATRRGPYPTSSSSIHAQQSISIPVGVNNFVKGEQGVDRRQITASGLQEIQAPPEISSLRWVPNANPFLAAGAPFHARGGGGMGGPYQPNDEAIHRHFTFDPHALLPRDQSELDERKEMLLSKYPEAMLRAEEGRLDREFAVRSGRLPESEGFRKDRDESVAALANLRESNKKKSHHLLASADDAHQFGEFTAFADASTDDGTGSELGATRTKSGAYTSPSTSAAVEGELQVVLDGKTGRSQLKRVVKDGWTKESSLSPQRVDRPPWMADNNLSSTPIRPTDADGNVIWFDGHSNYGSPAAAVDHNRSGGGHGHRLSSQSASFKSPWSKSFIEESQSGGKGGWLSRLAPTPPSGHHPEWQDYQLVRSHPPTPTQEIEEVVPPTSADRVN